MEPVDPGEHEKYQELYRLQDRILQIVFSAEQEFYLTGGTCISRFYQAKRYSDDLDFFTNASPRFAFAIRNIKQALQSQLSITTQVETKGFVRISAEDALQVDFLNDVEFRLGDPVVTAENYLVDSIENILSNKLTAAIGRDDAKDIFDIMLIYRFYDVSWPRVLEAAHQKAGFANDDLVVRLKTFPKEMLEHIKCIDCEFLNDFDDLLSGILNEILQAD